MTFYVVFNVFSMYFKNIITCCFHRCLKMTMDRRRCSSCVVAFLVYHFEASRWLGMVFQGQGLLTRDTGWATGRRRTLASLSDACDVLRWINSEIIFWLNALRSSIFSEKLLKRLFPPGWSPFSPGPSLVPGWYSTVSLRRTSLPNYKRWGRRIHFRSKDSESSNWNRVLNGCFRVDGYLPRQPHPSIWVDYSTPPQMVDSNKTWTKGGWKGFAYPNVSAKKVPAFSLTWRKFSLVVGSWP